MNLAIRKALPEDAYEYAACHISSWRSAYKGIVPDEFLNNLSVEKRAEAIRRELDEPIDYAYHCAVSENKIIGTLIIGKGRDGDKPNAGEVFAIYLLEEFRGGGYGAEMMDYATDALRRAGYGEAVVWVLEENVGARRFYEKRGFAFDGAKKDIEIGKPLVEMRYTRRL